MRPKVSAEKKRKTILGIKTDNETKSKIDWIAEREGTPTSTYVYNLIKEHIDQYTKIAKIDWSKEFYERR